MEQSRGDGVKWLQDSLLALGYLSPGDTAVFSESGEPLGVLNAATVQGLVRFKSDHNQGTGPTVGLETVNTILREVNGLLYQPTGPDDIDHMIIYHRNGGDLQTTSQRPNP